LHNIYKVYKYNLTWDIEYIADKPNIELVNNNWKTNKTGERQRHKKKPQTAYTSPTNQTYEDTVRLSPIDGVWTGHEPGKKQQTGAVLEERSGLQFRVKSPDMPSLQVVPVGANDKFHGKEKDNGEERVGERKRTGHVIRSW
jgi:hypothetical protein